MRYVEGEEEHRCSNCGFTFTGHYCPTCSQRAGVGRIGWHSVHQSVMELWGLGSRSHSVLYSALQLLFRPGYFIGDYIGGRRQVSFPPVKMMFILAVAVDYLINRIATRKSARGFTTS